MSHDQSHSEASSSIGVAFLLNFAFTILEIIGGLWANSIAILSDTLHDFGNSIDVELQGEKCASAEYDGHGSGPRQ